MSSKPNPNFMAGVPELLILRLLQDQELYGYEIVQAIRTGSSDILSLGEGVVYPVLHGLERDGALKSRQKTVAGRTRVYYALTAKGRRRFSDISSNWIELAGVIHAMLKGQRHVKAV